MSAPRTSSERAERPPAPPALLPENDAVPSRERPPRADAVDTGEERLRKSMADLAERQRRSVAALEDRIMRSHLQVHRRVVRNDPVRERGLVQPLEGFGPQNPTIGNNGASLGAIMSLLRDLQQRLEALEDQDDFRRPIGGDGTSGQVGEFFLATQHLEIGPPTSGETWWRVDVLNETAEWVSAEPSWPCDPNYHYGRVTDAWPVHLGRAGL